ncbi:MAG: type II toxin-antitoxin system HipA family toxin [Alphaproteobacteria bacterium]
MAALDVYFFDEKIGVLTQKEGKTNLSFKYLETATKAISLSLPLKNESYGDRETRGFFESLLPEGDIRKAIAKYEGVSENNPFALLRKIGGECAGAISLYEEGKKPVYGEERKILKYGDIQKKLKASKIPLAILLDNIRFSLAGAQDKIVITYLDGKVYFPSVSLPSNYIIKPENQYFENVIYNENYCMTLCRRVIGTAAVSGVYCVDIPFYIVQRYDRKTVGDNVFRLHQEDFCQVLSLYNKKYQKEGGPSLKTCYNLIIEHSSEPLMDGLRFLCVIIFNFIIGNSDAHGKNFSFLYEDEKISLAPFYDILSTQLYEKTDKDLSMSIGGEYDPDKIFLSHFIKMAKELGIKQDLVVKTISAIIDNILEQRVSLIEELKTEENNSFDLIIDKINELMDKRINQLKISPDEK